MSAGLRLFLCLVLLVCTSTAAASTHFDPDLAERRLVQFGISSASAYPEAGEPLTRVELMAHFVWALGLQTSAQLLHGATTYADVLPSMWYSGHIAVVKSLGIALDTPDNLFGPDEPVNLAETLAFTMRAVRLAPLTGLAYPEDHLAAAEDVGALTTAQAQEIHGAGTQVAGGRTALAILDRLFFHAPFDGGEPLYHLYSQVAPVLSVTSPAGDLQVTVPFVVEGSASAGQAHLYPLHVSVLVDGLPVGETSLEAAGTWSVDVEVETLHGGSHDLVVEAADFAGRKAPAVRLVISVEAPTGGSGGAGGSAGEGGAGGSAGEGGAGGSAGEGGAGGSAGEGGAGGSAGEGGTGGSAGEGGAGGSAGEGGAGGSAGEGGAGGSVGEGGAGSQPAKRKSSSGGCSQGSGASIAGLFLIGLFLVRRTSRALVRAR